MIHSQAIVEKSAKIASDVEIGPWTYIGHDVEIDSGTVIGPHAVIKGPTKMGKNCRVFQFASIGEDCMDKKYNGEPTRLEIGDNNIFRESCTIHRGTTQDEGVTRIGNDNLFMNFIHVAHDCVIGNNNVFANGATLAGHCVVGNDVIMGGYSGAHQYCRLGNNSMASMGAMIVKDVPAFVLVSGDTAKAHGMNVEGMRRRNYPKETIDALRKAYRVVYRQGLTVKEAVAELESWPEIEHLNWFIDSVKNSNRGITR